MYFKILLFIFCLSLSPTVPATEDTINTIEAQQTRRTTQTPLAISSGLNNQENGSDNEAPDHIKWGLTFIRNHQGLRGLIKYADTYFNGDILTAYNITDSYLNAETFEKLEWEKYESELDKIKEKISFFYTGRKLNKEVLSLNGQQTYAFIYHKGNLAKALHSARLILGDRKKIDKLKWVDFPGSIVDFRNTQNILYDENNNLRPEYRELSGQIRAAKEHFGSIQNTFHMAQATNPNRHSYNLNSWVKNYIGSAESLTLLLELLTEEHSRLKQSGNSPKESQYASLEGQITLGEKTNTHNMLTIYNNIKSISDVHSNEMPYGAKRFLTELSWTWVPFDGSPQQFATEKSYFINEEGKPHLNIFTMRGLAELAEKHYNGKMNLAFDMGELFFRAYNIPLSSLRWIKTEIDSEAFFRERDQLFNRDSTVKDKYKHPKGLAQYATDYHNGDMNKAHSRGRLFVHYTYPTSGEYRIYIDEDVRLQLGWVNSAQMKNSRLFWKYYNILFDKNGKPKKEWIGIEGQIKFAKRYTKGSMLSAWQTQLYIAGAPYDRVFQWTYIFGKAEETESIIRTFFDQKGQLKEKYKTQDGYLVYAEEHTKRDLSTAYTHSTYLPRSIQKALNWYHFSGSIEDYKRDYANFKQYPEMEGLIRFASEFYKKSIRKAYQNVLAFFNDNNEALHRATGWLPFSGVIVPIPPFVFNDTVSYYKRIKKALITETRNVNPLYKDMEGYIRFANQFYEGNMHAAYYDARAILETQDLRAVIGWLLFDGTTNEFKELRDFVLAVLTYHPVEHPSERPPRRDREITHLFMKKKKILPVHKKEYLKNVQTILSIYRPELAHGRCARGFTR